MSPDDQDLSSLIRGHATRHAAPDALRASIQAQIALAEAGRTNAPLPAAGWRRRWSAFGWRAAAIGFALGLASAVVVLPMLPRVDLNPPVEADLVAFHVRALQAGTLTDVASSDRHTVKPWFQGRLDYAPPVFDLSAHGFSLMGGRTEHVRGSVVATLAYTRNSHVIDVFVWPSAEQKTSVRSLRRGFNILRWSDGSMQYWVVSDLDRHELERFGKLWVEQASAL